MEPLPWPEPAPEVARAKNYGRQVPLPVAVRDRLGELFPDAEFARAFGPTGPSGWSPGRLALVTVLQMAENLTDRQVAQAVRDKLSWASRPRLRVWWPTASECWITDVNMGASLCRTRSASAQVSLRIEVGWRRMRTAPRRAAPASGSPRFVTAQGDAPQPARQAALFERGQVEQGEASLIGLGILSDP
jgi:hypothetical protein